jgi:MHS family proline/betaine transporter-like MFS transporter
MSEGGGASHATELAMADMRRRAILSCIVGNFFEMFDFTIYGFFAVAIGHNFFPAADPVSSTLSSLATFGVGFVMRPVGGLIIGAYGDRLGRKGALVLTVMLMAAATGLTGLIPSYQAIGMAAPVLLVLCRLLQGFSAGGEWGGAAAFLVEYAPPGRRGYFGSWHQVGVGLGTLAGSLCAFLMSATLSAASLDSWGWRMPFLFGVLLAPIGTYLRVRVSETPAFVAAVTSLRVERSPIAAAFSTHLRALLTASGSTIIWTVGGYLFLTFMPVYAVQHLGIGTAEALAANCIAIVFRTALTPPMGMLSDRIGRKPLVLSATLGFLLLSYPMFLWMIAAPGFVSLLGVQMAAALLMGVFSGPAPAMLSELFPTRVRTTSLSAGYNLVTALFGGFAPWIGAFLIRVTGQAIAPSYYVIACAAVSLLAISMIKDRAHEALR